MLGLAASIALKWPVGVQYALTFGLVFYSATSPLMLAWLSQSYRGTSDAAVGPALILTIGSLGAFLGPNIYGVTSDGASYITGHYAMAGVFGLGALLATAMRLGMHEQASDGRLVCRRWSRDAVSSSTPLLGRAKAAAAGGAEEGGRVGGKGGGGGGGSSGRGKGAGTALIDVEEEEAGAS